MQITGLDECNGKQEEIPSLDKFKSLNPNPNTQTLNPKP
jgi:hypothetical protein